MNQDLKILIEELERIQNNSNIDLTHSDIRAFIRAFIAAEDDNWIAPFSSFDYEEKSKILLYLKLIQAYGIPHIIRSRMAIKCLSAIESIEAKKKQKSADIQNNKDWDEIPF